MPKLNFFEWELRALWAFEVEKSLKNIAIFKGTFSRVHFILRGVNFSLSFLGREMDSFISYIWLICKSIWNILNCINLCLVLLMLLWCLYRACMVHVWYMHGTCMVLVWWSYGGHIMVISWLFDALWSTFDTLFGNFQLLICPTFWDSFILGGIDFIQYFPKTFLSLCTVRNERSLSKIRIFFINFIGLFRKKVNIDIKRMPRVS